MDDTSQGCSPRSRLSTTGALSPEARTWAVGLVNLAAMMLEIVGGIFLHSAALLAEGYHMGAHVIALSVAGFGYRIAAAVGVRRGGDAARRVGDAAAFVNAAILLAVAALLLVESIQHMARPDPIPFISAIALAVFGLVVNLLSLSLLHQRAEGMQGEPGDLSFRAIYLHMIGDFGVGALSVVGLGLAAGLHWLWADGAAGVSGAVLIAALAAQILNALRLGHRRAHRSPSTPPDAAPCMTPP